MALPANTMVQFAFQNLLSRPLRSLLSLLGLGFAIGGMVALFAIAGGIDYVVTRTFEQIPGLMVQQRGSPVPLFSTLPAEWEEELKQLSGVSVVDPQIVSRINVINRKTIISPPRFVVGMDIETRSRLVRDIYRENMIAGRMLTLEDTDSNHCLVSRQIASEFNADVGDVLTINGVRFQIVGLYHTGSMLLDGNVLLSMPRARELTRISDDTVSFYYVEAAAGADKQQLKLAIEDLFHDREIALWRPSSAAAGGGLVGSLLQGAKTQAERYFGSTREGRIEGGSESSAASESAGSQAGELAQTGAAGNGDAGDGEAESAVEVRMAEDWSDRFAEFSGDLNLILGLITTVGVLIAIFSIVNTMMMSVTERTTEFGILRANGWSQGQIMQLMTLESGLLGVVGGVIGVLLGVLGVLAANARWPDKLQLYASPQLLLFGVLFSTLIGIAGGLYPAWSAARLSPMESIRRG